MSRKKEFTEEEIKLIIEYYKINSLKDTSIKFGISKDLIKKILSNNDIPLRNVHESAKIGLIKYKLNSLLKYGVEFPAQAKEVKEKAKQTCLERYGTEYTFQNKDIKEKCRQTMKLKYGVEYSALSKLIFNKLKKTCLERYGNSCSLQSAQAKEKSRLTCLEHFGVENPFLAEEVKEKIKLTCLNRYGAYNISQSLQLKEKLKNRTLEEWKIIKDKRNETRRKNGTFNTSKPEDLYYEYLLSLYSGDDIVRLYSSDVYPFACDFYIKSKDLYIECNYSWTHGPHPFNSEDAQDLLLLEEWKTKSENSDYYKNAIYTWTDLDVRKLLIAKDNNLNYIILY